MIPAIAHKSNIMSALKSLTAGILYALAINVVVFIGAFRLNLYTDRAYANPRVSETRVFQKTTIAYWRHMTQWDSGWYERIARNGYQGSETAFFPLYPLLTRAILLLKNSFAFGSGAVSFLALIGALYFFIRLTENEIPTNDGRTRALFFFLFFPTAFYLLAPYTEGLFLCLLLGSIYFARARKLCLAGLFGFGAALTRVNGFFLVILLGYEMYAQWRARDSVHKKDALWQKIMVFLSPLAGLASYMIYLKIYFGNFLQFAVSQTQWDRNGSLNPIAVAHRFTVYFREFLQLPSVLNAEFISRALDMLFFIFIIAVSIWMWRAWRKDFALWTLSLVILPLFSGTLLSMPRYVFASPFVAMFLARQIKNENARLSIFACFMALWTLLLIMFSNGYWVA